MARRGLIVGKFYPPHRGHKHLIDAARARVEELTVIVCRKPGETPTADLRAQWLREIHPDVRFLVVGDNSLAEAHREHYAAVRKMLADAGVEPLFVFTGFREDVPRMIDALDVFVLCTHFEGFGLVIIEAMARTKPAVATAVGGVLEIITDGVTGLLHPHRDDERLAAHIVSLLDSPERAAALAEAGREFVRATFTNEKFAADITRFYRGVVRGGPGRTAPAEGGGL